MKKILLSLAAVAMTITANAAPTVVKVNPDQASTVPAETVINNNDFFTATTTFNAKGGKAGSAYVFGDVDLGGSGWIQLRSESAPDATSPFGAQRTDCTSVKFEVKKPVTIYCYIRTGNNKQTAVKMFNSSFELLPYANGATEGKNCGADGVKNNMWEFSWTLNAGTYCMTELAGTGNVAGIGYEEAAGEDPEPAQGETFEVQGNGATLWDKTFDSVTIPFEFNKETKVATFTNFLGSNASFTIKFEITDPNRDPDALDSTFNSVAVSGLGEGEANGGHTIDGFTDPIILNQDNAPFGKLENALFWTGYNTQMKVETADINGTTVIVYAMKFMLGGGDYYPWDAATSTWGEKAATSQYEFINLIKKIPVNAGGDESGIEDIVTDNVDENAPVEYYNLQGIRLSDPAAGQIVIRRQGSKVSKILVR